MTHARKSASIVTGCGHNRRCGLGAAKPDAGGDRRRLPEMAGHRPAEHLALDAPLQRRSRIGRQDRRDVKYGAADRNLLDVFVPEAATDLGRC